MFKFTERKMIKNLVVMTVFSFNFWLIATSIEINLNKGWQIKNANGSKSSSSHSEITQKLVTPHSTVQKVLNSKIKLFRLAFIQH